MTILKSRVRLLIVVVPIRFETSHKFSYQFAKVSN
jgi:hypothetical protein